LFLLPMAVRNVAVIPAHLLAREPGKPARLGILRGLAQAISGKPVQEPTPREALDGMLRSGPYKISLAEVEAAPSGLDFGAPMPGVLPERLRSKDQTVAVRCQLHGSPRRAARAGVEPRDGTDPDR